jgi:serine/threonine protein kinase
MPNSITCQPDRLEAFLSGELVGCEEEQLTAHLNECALCRRRLDEAAAEPETWTRATTYLKDDPLDRSSISELGDEPLSQHPQIKQVLAVLNATDDPAVLGRLGSYEVSGVVGAGGMGIVLKAFDRPLDRTVAIKVMAPYLATSGAARQRFSREARAAAAVIHPNVISIYGVSTDSPLPYLVMPYIAGASLQKRLDTEGALPVADILRIGIQIASGLAAAHDQGLVHRDIKPANILLDQGVDRLVITDFGLARTVDEASVTRTGVIAGTPKYMSPEQARGELVDARSDLFSLGSVLYAACTGRAPFRAESPYGVLRRITDNAPRSIREINPQIPDWLCRIIDRLHAKGVTDRFQSAEEVAQLLTQCLAHLSQPTEHSLPRELKTSIKSLRVKLRSVLLITAAATVFTALAFLAADYFHVRDATDSTTSHSSASPEPQIPATASTATYIELPWKAPDAATAWTDNLTPVFQHIEQSLREP